ncbi:hypothetical protein ANO14919_122240 [Xylariales sp. No.14919]|nr:hypothetical protein ANO14919_122240 [Xylariales sp. No.14919]
MHGRRLLHGALRRRPTPPAGAARSGRSAHFGPGTRADLGAGAGGG